MNKVEGYKEFERLEREDYFVVKMMRKVAKVVEEKQEKVEKQEEVEKEKEQLGGGNEQLEEEKE